MDETLNAAKSVVGVVVEPVKEVAAWTVNTSVAAVSNVGELVSQLLNLGG